MSSRTPSLVLGVLLLALVGALTLPGTLLLPPTDRDEARFMQSTKQMLETGDLGHIRFQEQPRDKKPIGAYWAQVAAVRLSGAPFTGAWAYRLPSVLGLAIAALATAWAAGSVSAGIILATTLIAFVEGHLAKADALLLGAGAVAFAAALRAYRDEDVPLPARILFWIALGLAILIKGPILPVVMTLAGITLAVGDRSLGWVRSLSPGWGLPVTLVIVLAWPTVAGWEEVWRTAVAGFRQDLAPKLLAGVESHGAPPGTHLALALVTLWPWSVLVPGAALRAWRDRGEPATRFCLAWIVPFWLALEAVPTKLPHYILPVVPAIAVLLVLGPARSWSPRRVALGGIGGLALIVAALAAAPRLSSRVPTFQQLIVSERLAAALMSMRDPHRPVALVGYHEPSAVFLLGTRTLLAHPAEAASLLARESDAIAVIESRAWAEFLAACACGAENLDTLATLSGYNYSRGQPITLHVVMRKPAAAP